MSEQLTPETDAFFFRIDIDWDMEVEFARKLERERDEARINAEKSKAYKKVLKVTNENLKRELTEARNAIVGWENKWRCAVDMAARAELERDEALKCAKEYYVEFIRNASSDNKISKPNPLNPFYKY